MTHLEDIIPDYFVPDALSVDERRMVEAHIQTCADCSQVFDDWQRISHVARLRQSAASLPPLRLPEPILYMNGRKAKMNTLAMPHTYKPRSTST